MQRKDFRVPQLFAAAGNLHSLTPNSCAVLTSLSNYCLQLLTTTVPWPNTTYFFNPRSAIFFLVFWCINIFFKYLPQIIFQTCENVLAKFEGRTLTSVNTCLQWGKGYDFFFFFFYKRDNIIKVSNTFFSCPNSSYLDDVLNIKPWNGMPKITN